MEQEKKVTREQVEDLFRKYKMNSWGASIFYLLIILVGILTIFHMENFASYKYPVFISLFVFTTLFVILFINSYKSRYVFFKRINKLEKVEYKIMPLVYLFICIPFLFCNMRKMSRELESLEFTH